MSYLNLQSWITSIHEHANEKVIKYLIGNKVDLADRKVSREEGQKMANDFEMKYFEASAKTNLNVTESIESMIRDIRSQFSLNEQTGIKLKREKMKKMDKKKRKGGCCTIF